MPLRLCFCRQIPRLTVRTRVLVVRHWFESHRLTNTGRLVQLALEGAELADHGRKDFRLSAEALGLLPDSCLLFPAGDRGAPVWTGGRPGLLVVPDGSWAQARRMVKRLPGLAKLPRLELPPGPEPTRRIRRSPFPGGRSTLEAVADALALWEEPEVPKALRKLYDLLATRADEASGNMRRV